MKRKHEFAPMERQFKSPTEAFNDEGAKKYKTEENVRIQAELTEAAVRLIESFYSFDTLNKPKYPIISDLGCGSGFSTNSLISKYGTKSTILGCDISMAMIKINQSTPLTSLPCQNKLLCLADLKHLPFKPNSVDIAISISTIQWLLNDPDQCSFFAGLLSIMKQHAIAVLQFYPENEMHPIQLQKNALRCGFNHSLLVKDMPHRTLQRKWMLVLIKHHHVPAEILFNNLEHHSMFCAVMYPHRVICSLMWFAKHCSDKHHDRPSSLARAKGVVVEHQLLRYHIDYTLNLILEYLIEKGDLGLKPRKKSKNRIGETSFEKNLAARLCTLFDTTTLPNFRTIEENLDRVLEILHSSHSM